MHFAIFQTWGLGDLTMTTPVISEFRRLYPQAQLTLIVGGHGQAELMRGSPMVDTILEYPRSPTPTTERGFCLNLRRCRIDAAFIGTRIKRHTAWLLRDLGGIPVIIGDAADNAVRKAGFPYNICNTVDPDEHRVDRMLNTFALWSRQPTAIPRFCLTPRADAVGEATSILARHSLLPRRFIVVHPGSSGGPKQTDKRIPVDVALRLADNIVRHRQDLSIAFMLGPDDNGLISQFQDLGPRQVALSRCSLPTTVALISQAAGFIGSDSGLGHIAAALDVPTITLIGPTIPSETAPYGARATTITRLERLECQPCWFGPLHGRCPHGVRCMHELPEADILATVMTWETSPRNELLP